MFELFRLLSLFDNYMSELCCYMSELSYYNLEL